MDNLPISTDDVPLDEAGLPIEVPGWQLKKLTQKHKDVCSLVAQGLKRGQVAQICDITPEYVTMLMRQPLCMAFIQELNVYAGVQLEAAYAKSVEVICEVMETGNDQDRLKAARLQLEATKRIGRPDPSAGQGAGGSEERLINLAERLTGLLAKASSAAATQQEIQDAEFRDVTGDGLQGQEVGRANSG